MSRVDIHSHNSVFMKLLKYYLTSGTLENQTFGIIVQICFVSFQIFKLLCGEKTPDKEVKVNLTPALKKTLSLCGYCTLRFSKQFSW